jgi:hypothetical protein
LVEWQNNRTEGSWAQFSPPNLVTVSIWKPDYQIPDALKQLDLFVSGFWMVRLA